MSFGLKRASLIAGVVVVLALALVMFDRFVLSPRLPPPPSSPVRGQITEISGDSRGINLVSIETDDGEQYAVHIDPEFDYEFDLQLLEQFQERNEPIIIEWRIRDGEPLATSIRKA